MPVGGALGEGKFSAKLLFRTAVLFHKLSVFFCQKNGQFIKKYRLSLLTISIVWGIILLNVVQSGKKWRRSGNIFLFSCFGGRP